MKKKVICVFSLILYLLVVCTMLSEKIEVEMQVQVEVTEKKVSKKFAGTIQADPSHLFSDGWTDHLYEIQDGTGWESGLRVVEFSSQDWKRGYGPAGDPVVELAEIRDMTLIHTASRLPVSGEQVEVIERPETAPDQYLVYYPNGVPRYDELPAGVSLVSETENALLLDAEQGKYPFFEHRAITVELEQIAVDGMRVFSLTTVKEFQDQIPSLVTVLVLALIPVFLWGVTCFQSINAERNKWLIVMNILLAVTALVLMQNVLGRIDLPAAMLPERNIFDWQHYSDELTLIFDNLEKMGIAL